MTAVADAVTAVVVVDTVVVVDGTATTIGVAVVVVVMMIDVEATVVMMTVGGESHVWTSWKYGHLRPRLTQEMAHTTLPHTRTHTQTDTHPW
eukprot:m.75375 g.75375  ORF g.75375 m.75375 type:complete len:92 (+) comp8990_c1_seq3:1129-1404(+)